NSYGTPVSLDEVLMISLVHGVLVSIGDGVGMREIPPVWDLVSPFLAQADFLGYWRDECPVSTGSEELLASAYLMPEGDTALIIVSNWAYKPGEGTLTLDWKKLGMTPATSSIVEPLEDNRSHPAAATLELSLPARDFRAFVITGR
ncbi:MAG: hypothetical protein HON70_32190, partial [Lentisphaerae bacterium]|nr:hypothetical protein [Lentisphaerota bacterium]